jgi:hypothetical protein
MSTGSTWVKSIFVMSPWFTTVGQCFWSTADA